MRDYGKISPQFWTGETGRAIRKAGRDAQVVAIYLISCPSSNMIGLYYLPLPTLCHEVGLTTEGASKALRSLFEAQFASWDAPSEHVFVVEMAAHQIGQRLDRNDKRVKAVIREWQAMRKSPFYRDFWKRYSTAYHLPEPSPFDAPSMPLRCHEHEHEHEEEQEHESICVAERHEDEDDVEWNGPHNIDPHPVPNGRTRKPSPYSPEFERFWSVYPPYRRTAKGAAWKVWQVALRLIDADTLIRRATEYAASPRGQSDYAKMPATWLNGRCWEDSGPAWGVTAPAGPNGSEADIPF